MKRHEKFMREREGTVDEATENVIRRVRDQRALSTLIGEAPAFLKAMSHLVAVAHSDSTVLITGETGTGKELVACAIHYLSERAAFPFVAVNCGSLPDTLLENELFGHERGAFTDAGAGRPGLVAQAEKGTIRSDSSPPPLSVASPSDLSEPLRDIVRFP